MSEDRLTADEQALLDQMRADDAQPGSPEPSPPPASPSPPSGTEAQPDQPAPPKMVPLAALHEERELHKRTRSDLAEERTRIRTLEERTNLLLQRFNQPQPEPPKPAEPPQPTIPALETDPVQHILGRVNRAEATAQANQQTLEQHQQQQNLFQQQATLLYQLNQRGYAAEQEFTRRNEDYPRAIDHLVQMRHRELELIQGIRDPGQRQQIIQGQWLEGVARAVQDGGNPAERFYELAKVYGYAPSPATSGLPGTEGTENEAQPQTQSSSAQNTAQARLQNIAEGQQQARSLPAGAPVTGALNARRLAEMSDAEFQRLYNSKPEDVMAQMGA